MSGYHQGARGSHQIEPEGDNRASSPSENDKNKEKHLGRPLAIVLTVVLGVAGVAAVRQALSTRGRAAPGYGSAPSGTDSGYTPISATAPPAATGRFVNSAGDGGPQHTDTSLVFLGTSSEGAADGLFQPTSEAGGPKPPLPCEEASVVALVTVGPNAKRNPAGKAYLNVFADWNRDGTFGGEDGCAEEWVVKDIPVSLEETRPTGSISVPLRFRTGEQTLQYWRRTIVSLEELGSRQDIPGVPRHPLVGGETEDVLVDWLSENGKPPPCDHADGVFLVAERANTVLASAPSGVPIWARLGLSNGGDSAGDTQMAASDLSFGPGPFPAAVSEDVAVLEVSPSRVTRPTLGSIELWSGSDPNSDPSPLAPIRCRALIVPDDFIEKTAPDPLSPADPADAAGPGSGNSVPGSPPDSLPDTSPGSAGPASRTLSNGMPGGTARGMSNEGSKIAIKVAPARVPYCVDGWAVAGRSAEVPLHLFPAAEPTIAETSLVLSWSAFSGSPAWASGSPERSGQEPAIEASGTARQSSAPGIEDASRATSFGEAMAEVTSSQHPGTAPADASVRWVSSASGRSGRQIVSLRSAAGGRVDLDLYQSPPDGGSVVGTVELAKHGCSARFVALPPTQQRGANGSPSGANTPDGTSTETIPQGAEGGSSAGPSPGSPRDAIAGDYDVTFAKKSDSCGSFELRWVEHIRVRQYGSRIEVQRDIGHLSQGSVSESGNFRATGSGNAKDGSSYIESYSGTTTQAGFVASYELQRGDCKASFDLEAHKR